MYADSGSGQAVSRRAGRKKDDGGAAPGGGQKAGFAKKAVFESTKKKEVGVSDLGAKPMFVRLLETWTLMEVVATLCSSPLQLQLQLMESQVTKCLDISLLIAKPNPKLSYRCDLMVPKVCPQMMPA